MLTWQRVAHPQAKLEPGLVATFVTDEHKAADLSLAPGVHLYVEHSKSPTPWLSGGRFTAVWQGALSAELRSEYFFQAELNGRLKLEINGAVALESAGVGGASPLSGAVKLNKGPNSFKATFNSPASGDAFVRLDWTEKGTNTSPIPTAAFTHPSSPELQKALLLRCGRELFLEHRCAKCHAAKADDSHVPDLKMDAPSFEGLGARRNYGWMAAWILDPRSLRPTALMPKLLHGPKAKDDAEAIAAYLASLKSGGEVVFAKSELKTKQNVPVEGEGAVSQSEPKALYERLHCIGCHDPPDATETDPEKISQKRVAEKFPPDKLAEFLRAPEAHYAWTRMPNFHLTAKEAKELEEWLFAAAGKPRLANAPVESAILERGKKLVQTAGCLNCHNWGLENQAKAPALEALRSRHLKDRTGRPPGDCLGATPFADYGFSAEERAALDAFTLAGFASLMRHVPAEFAERHSRLLNCVACHGQIDQIPALEILGSKLKPEWTKKFIAGEIPHKIRYDAHPKGEPWVEARMPAFRSRAAGLAEGLAALHGFPPRTSAEPPIAMDLAQIGQKLVGKEGGFSCLSCHAVGSVLALEVFESEGINLAYVEERILLSYFRRWMRTPLGIDPQTKMPTYFDEGKSPLTEILDGDAEKQIDAVWQYLRLGDKMPLPSIGEQ